MSRPWFGGEAAVAVLAGAAATPERVDLLEVGDGDGAAGYADSLAVGDAQTSEYEGVELSADRSGVATAQVEGFLVIGTEDGVRAVIATATGRRRGPDAARRRRCRQGGPRPAARRPLCRGVGLGGRCRLPARARPRRARLAQPADLPGLDPRRRGRAERLRRRPRARRPLRPSTPSDPIRPPASSPPSRPSIPSCPTDLPAGTLAYLGIGAPADTVTALLDQASTQAPGIAAGFRGLVDQVRRTRRRRPRAGAARRARRRGSRSRSSSPPASSDHRRRAVSAGRRRRASTRPRRRPAWHRSAARWPRTPPTRGRGRRPRSVRTRSTGCRPTASACRPRSS